MSRQDVLRDMIRSDRIPNTVIIESMSPEDLASFLAAAAVCSSDGPEKPCGLCPDCKKAKSGTHPDITEIRPVGKANVITVEMARELRSDAYIQPNDADRKVYILYNADLCTEQAANALLKILEEPPVYAVFILCCASAGSLLPTVRSRGVIVSDFGEAKTVVAGKIQKKAEEIRNYIKHL